MTGFDPLLGLCIAVDDHPVSGESVAVWVDVPETPADAARAWGRLPVA